VNLPPGDTEGVRGLCLDPHDLAIAKHAACREKDLVFTRELARRGITSKKRILELLEQTDITGGLREKIRARIAVEFEQPAPR
jgi:isopentenyl phosphate kinase